MSFASPAMAATPFSRTCPNRIIPVHLLVAPGFRAAVAAGQSAAGARSPGRGAGALSPRGRRPSASGFRVSPHRPWAWASWSHGLIVRRGGPWAGQPAAPAVGGGNCPRTGAHPPHRSASPHAASRIGPGAPGVRPCRGRPVGVGFSAVPQVASASTRRLFPLVQRGI